VVFDDRGHSACASCAFRTASFCSALIDASDAKTRPPLRQSFGGATANQTVYYRGAATDDVFVLCQGWAFRVAQLADGRRQILSVLQAGDLFSAKLVFQNAIDTSVQALTEIRFSRIKRADLRARMALNPALLDAFAGICASEARTADALLIDLGRRTADERIAHFILSIAKRYGERNVVRDLRFPFPFRQQDIADLLGLTPVHVSRVMTKLRQASLIELASGILKILNLPELENIGCPRRL
jgi:CRP/FNR family transcriptional regulator